MLIRIVVYIFIFVFANIPFVIADNTDEMNQIQYDYGGDPLSYYKFKPNTPFNYNSDLNDITNEDEDCETYTETTTNIVGPFKTTYEDINNMKNRWITRNKCVCKKKIHKKKRVIKKPVKKKPRKPRIQRDVIIKKYYIYRDTVHFKNCRKNCNCPNNPTPSNDECCDECSVDGNIQEKEREQEQPIILRCE